MLGSWGSSTLMLCSWGSSVLVLGSKGSSVLVLGSWGSSVLVLGSKGSSLLPLLQPSMGPTSGQIVRAQTLWARSGHHHSVLCLTCWAIAVLTCCGALDTVCGGNGH